MPIEGSRVFKFLNGWFDISPGKHLVQKKKKKHLVQLIELINNQDIGLTKNFVEVVVLKEGSELTFYLKYAV